MARSSNNRRARTMRSCGSLPRSLITWLQRSEPSRAATERTDLPCGAFGHAIIGWYSVGRKCNLLPPGAPPGADHPGRDVRLRPVVGRRPDTGRALGAYGSSTSRAVGSWVFALFLLAQRWLGAPSGSTVWMRVADAAWVALWIWWAYLLTFTPSLIITTHHIKRRLRGPVAWSDVSEILPPSTFGRDVRIRLTDKTVIELRGVGPERRQALLPLVASHQVP